MENQNIEPTGFYPTKPTLEEEDGKNSIMKSIMSMVLFVVAFYLVFGLDLKFIFLLVVVLFIHEMGHFAAMKWFNYKDVKMFFIPLLGALVTGTKKQVSQKQRAIILLAGPIPGIILGGIMYFVGIKYQMEYLLIPALLFILLNMFNLLPLTPLDGGNLVETLFFKSREKLQKNFIILSALGLVAISLYMDEYFLLIIPGLLLFRISRQSKITAIKTALNEQEVDYDKPYEEISDDEYWKIRKEIVKTFGVFKDKNLNDVFDNQEEKPVIKIMESLYSQRMILDMSNSFKFLFSAIWVLFFLIPVLVYFFYLNPTF